MEQAENMVERILQGEFVRMVERYHYSKLLPRINKVFLGDRELQMVMSLGYGVRPLHTIRALFPSLTAKDYLEIGRMCASDDMPRNTESRFLSRAISWVRSEMPDVKLIFTWSDGMLGKPGYVYQASNFLYGGYIWTDTYISAEGEKIHPRMTNKIGGRPTREELHGLRWLHYKGKQFRYVYFLCSKTERKRLMSECTVPLTREYPKHQDLEWMVDSGSGWAKSEMPPYNPITANFSDNAKRSRLIASQGLLFGDIDSRGVNQNV